MSGSEDYLDKLLNAVEKGEQPETPEITEADEQLDTSMEVTEIGMGKEDTMDDFMDELEKELTSGISSDDDFLRDIELELASEDNDMGVEDSETEPAPTPTSDPFLENLDGIVNSVKENLSGKDQDAMADDFMIDTMGEDVDGAMSESMDDSLDVMDDSINDMDDSFDDMENESEDDQGLMDLLKSDGEFSDIGDMLQADEENMPLEDSSAGNMGNASDVETGDFFGNDGDSLTVAGAEETAETPEKKMGFFQKISKALFGDDEEEEEATTSVKVAPVAPPSIEELNDENLQILRELENGGGEEPVAAEPEEDKKKKKKEKKEKKKKEKQPKEKKPKKPKKEKKPKPPKVPDNTPPLPKKPVILIAIMAISFLALVLLGTTLLGYSNNIRNAEQAYALGDYETALAEMSGIEVKEDDMPLYEKTWVLANASGQYSAYETFMANDIYDMALDTLIKTVGRCEKYQLEAEELGCSEELAKIDERATGALSGFGVTREYALEMYECTDRLVYSTELYNILKDAGFEVTTE